MNPDMFFLLASVLFSIGLVGIVSRRNLFIVYISIELMLSSINLILATLSKLSNDPAGSVMALIIIAVIAAEAALFLAIIIHLNRLRRSIDSDDFKDLAQSEVK
ncbi:NADH-quinone oxidoreductase subunit NuoK [Sulfurimonas sp.]|uniref:NADH-quinone oxidoreductase subunit NuoK n=1 Tax=Sulfurimonas sp. TaxID=2022749 RepID=UPI0035617E0C